MPAELDLLAGQWLPAFFLVLARVGGLFLFAPIFSSRLVVSRVKVLLALSLTLALVPSELARTVPTDVVSLAALMVKEVVIGTAIGFSVSVVVTAVQVAGAYVDMIGGFAFANVVDPMQGTQISILGQMYSLLGTSIFLVTGGPLVVIAGFSRSFDMVQIDQMPAFDGLARGAVEATAGLLATAIVIAAPVIVTLVLTDVAVGFLARLAPQMNIFGIEMPAKILALLALLAATMPLLAGTVQQHVLDGLGSAFQILPEMRPR